MSDRVAVAGAAAGTAGASYRRILTYLGKVAGNYIVNEANFPGLGPYLPCLAVIVLTPGAGGGTINISPDNGTVLWLPIAGGTVQFGRTVYLDTATTFMVQFTTNAGDVRIFVQ